MNRGWPSGRRSRLIPYFSFGRSRARCRQWTRAQVASAAPWFAPDSLLEGDGFQLSVPVAKEVNPLRKRERSWSYKVRLEAVAYLPDTDSSNPSIFLQRGVWQTIGSSMAQATSIPSFFSIAHTICGSAWRRDQDILPVVGRRWSSSLSSSSLVVPQCSHTISGNRASR
jgi:hypothetical protein